MRMLSALLLSGVATQAKDIAGYTPGSNVVQHNQIDLDQKAIVTNVGAYNFSEAKTIYSSGHANGTDWAISNSCGYNSCSKGAARTLRGFSTNAKARMYDKSDKCVGCPYKTYLKFYEYYGDFDYADKWVMAALDNTTYTPANAATTHAPGFSSSEDAARKEAVQKGTAYMVVWMYAIREFEDAIDDCNSCTANCNEYSTSSGGAYNAVHAWDEGVAFYTGSLAGETADHNQQGEMPFALAEKRCTNYGTCSGAGGISYVNEELFKLFNQGRDTLIAGSCSAVRPILDDIIRLMTVPLVQGTLRYAWKVGTTNGQPNLLSDQTAKNHAEGAVFAQALLPLVHYCNPTAAKTVADHMKFSDQAFATSGNTGTFPVTADVKAALESTYNCLGITCDQVGQLLNPAKTAAEPGMEACTLAPYDANTPFIAGYAPGSGVVQHNKLDLDQKAIVTKVGAYNFSEAKTIYSSGHANGTDWAISNGGYNSLSKGAARTLQGFTKNAKARMFDTSATNPEGPYKTYLKFFEYYGDFDYADKWVMAALDGKTYTPANAATTHAPGFSSSENAARKEAVQKGTAYMVVWMYAIREFEDAIDDCNHCTANCNQFSTSDKTTGQYNAVHAWDEGVAFYTGSEAGETPDHDQQGEMPYALAEKRCANYGTCSGPRGTSEVNNELFKLFNQGRDTLIAGSCSAVRPILDDIIRLMTVPLVQGTLRYAWKVGVGSDGQPNALSSQTAKNHAEGAVFAQALLPLVHYCNPTAAKTVADHMKFSDQAFATSGNTGTFPVTAAVKAALESTYNCLGVTCAQVGHLLNPAKTAAEPGMEACTLAPYDANTPFIAGYAPGSGVVQHNQIDLDQKAIVTQVGDYNWDAAEKIYTNGGSNADNSCGYNSCSKGAARTLQGFSTNAKARMYDKSDKCVGCPYKTYLKFFEYYGDFDYADKWVMAALGDGTTYTPANAATTHAPGFSSSEDAARKEAVQKGTAYMVVWMYAIREFEDAIDDCNSCTANCNEYSTKTDGAYNSVHAWDEGVAFYTGSLAGETPDHDQQGEMPYALAEKRCANYGTCSGPRGTSEVNNELFKLFNQGRDTLIAGSCSAVRPILDDIIRLMTVPLVQGTLRYAWKVGVGSDGQPNAPSSQTAKNHAEGAVFAQALLPLVHYCNPTAAKTVADHMKFDGQTFPTGGGITGTTPDTAAVKAALESTYSCLGITCAHVGGLLKNDNDLAGGYYTGMGVCTEITHSPPPPPPPPSKLSTGKKIAVKVKAAGAVSDYDDKKKAELEFAMATVAGVSADAVTVTVTAGSVILDFEIITTDPEATKTTVSTALADKIKATAALGVTVEETPTVAVVADADDDDGLSGGAIAGIAIGAIVGLLCISGIIFFAMKSGKNVDPK